MDIAPGLPPGLSRCRLALRNRWMTSRGCGSLPRRNFALRPPGVTQVEAKADFGGQAIEQVEFAVDGEVKFTDGTEPFVFEWQNRRVGKFVIIATAQGADGEAVQSPGVEFEVVPRRRADEAVLIAKGSRWRYLDTGEPPGENWIDGEFDDSLWLEGPAQLGYGEGDEATRIRFGDDPGNKHITTWFRRAIVVDDPGRLDALKLLLQSDDGAVVYINGHEVLPVSYTHLTLPTICSV